MDEIPSTSSQASKEGKATAESASSVQNTSFTSEFDKLKPRSSTQEKAMFISMNQHHEMISLNLSDCEIGDDGFLAMSSFISNIKNLIIRGSHSQLSMKGITALSDAVQKLHTPMEQIAVFCNPSIRVEARKELERCKHKCKLTFWP